MSPSGFINFLASIGSMLEAPLRDCPLGDEECGWDSFCSWGEGQCGWEEGSWTIVGGAGVCKGGWTDDCEERLIIGEFEGIGLGSPKVDEGMCGKVTLRGLEVLPKVLLLPTFPPLVRIFTCMKNMNL